MAGDNGTGKCINSAVVGTYQQIVPNELLVFSWGWPEDPSPETLVTVEFRDAEGGTEVVLTQERIPNAEVAQRNQFGWTGMLEKLAGLAEAA